MQTFFQGHDDEDDFHYVNSDGTRRCAKCGDPMGAFDKVRIRGGPAEKCTQCAKLVSDLLAVETPSGRYCSSDCVVAHAKGEIKTAMTPVGERPSKRSLDVESLRDAEERERFRADLAAKIADHARRTGIPIQSFDMKDAVDAAEQQEIAMLKEKIQKRAESLGSFFDKGMVARPVQGVSAQFGGAAPDQQANVRAQFDALKRESAAAAAKQLDARKLMEAARMQQMQKEKAMKAMEEEKLKRSLMTQGYGTFAQAAQKSEASMVKEIAAKLSQLTPEQVTQARARAVEALEVALFHTDSAVQAHLLMNAKFDDPNEASIELNRLWTTDANGWRSDAAKRAGKMVEIMDARGKRTLRGP